MKSLTELVSIVKGFISTAPSKNDKIEQLRSTNESFKSFDLYLDDDTRRLHAHAHTLVGPSGSKQSHYVISPTARKALHYIIQTSDWLVAFTNTSFVVRLQSCLRVQRRITAYVISHFEQKTDCKVAYCSKFFLIT